MSRTLSKAQLLQSTNSITTCGGGGGGGGSTRYLVNAAFHTQSQEFQVAPPCYRANSGCSIICNSPAKHHHNHLHHNHHQCYLLNALSKHSTNVNQIRHQGGSAHNHGSRCSDSPVSWTCNREVSDIIGLQDLSTSSLSSGAVAGRGLSPFASSGSAASRSASVARPYQTCSISPPTISDDSCMQLRSSSTGGNAIVHKAHNITVCCNVYKNLLVLSISFMFLFTAFTSLQALQSSIHSHVGMLSLCCYYGATLISCFIAPAVIGKLTTKWTICLGFCFYFVHVMANFYPVVYLLIPSSIVLGVFTGPMWSAQSTYLTTLAIRYAQSSGRVLEATISGFNGIFFGFLHTSQAWGNLISSAVLAADNHTIQLNRLNTSVLKYACGAKDCGMWDEFPVNALSHHMAPLAASSRNMLLCIYLALVMSALVLTTVLLNTNDINTSGSMNSVSLSSSQLLVKSIQMFQNPQLQLLTPLVVYTGLEQGFVLGDFTKSYINCALGIHNVGYVMVCFGAVNACCSIVIGHVTKHIKRYPIMISGTLFNCCLLIVLLWWQPNQDDPPMFYVISACLGLCDSIWQTQTNALFGVLFSNQQEAAFSCYRMLQCVGFALAFGFGVVLCVNTKVYIMGCVMAAGVALYSVVEVQLKRKGCADIVVL